MKFRHPRHVLSLIIFLFVMAGITEAFAADFDYKKTEEFMREMETRPDFPVSVVLAHDYVYTLTALAKPISKERRAAIATFIKGMQQKDGGFTADKASKDSSLLYTTHAMDLLSLLDAGGSVDSNRVKNYIVSLKNPDGSFSFGPKSRTASIATTYYAVRLLEELHALDGVDKAKTAAYVKSFVHRDGGFGFVKNTGMATMQNTFYGVYTLQTLGMLDNSTKRNVLGYLERTQYVSGNYDLKGGGPQVVEEQVYAIETLKMLGADKKIPKVRAYAMLKKFYIKVNGGFGPILGYGSTPDSTTAGIRLLVAIGKLKEPKRFPIVKK